jgi:hypothetical protein
MLLIVFLGLIAELMMVSGDCVVGNQDVNLNWNEVGISVLTQFLKQAVFYIAAWGLYFICGFITELSIEYIRLYFRVIELFVINYLVTI